MNITFGCVWNGEYSAPKMASYIRKLLINYPMTDPCIGIYANIMGALLTIINHY